jgi:tetratricopeptide (TPR) repeat protein
MFLDELSKRESLLKHVENRTAWIGAKFKTGIVLKGAYNIIDNSQLIMDYAYWDLTKEKIPNNITRPDELANIFKIEKDIVLGLTRKMNLELKPALRDSLMKTSVTDLPAFIAYSAGLAKEDGGEYKDAIVFYRKALELAPNFRDCTERIEVNEALSLAQRDPDKAITDRDFAEAN